MRVTDRDLNPAYPFSANVPSDCIRDWIRENTIEWYASWYVGAAKSVGGAGFRGVLEAGSEARLKTALQTIKWAEARSRIVVDYTQLEHVARSLHKRSARIVFTNGVFDLCHIGHLRLLERARALGDALIVAINSDDSTRTIKGRGRPVIRQFARAQLLASLRFVDTCFIFPETDPTKALEAVRPDVLVKGSEYALRRIVGGTFVSRYGGEVVRIPMVADWSTTSLIRGIQEID